MPSQNMDRHGATGPIWSALAERERRRRFLLENQSGVASPQIAGLATALHNLCQSAVFCSDRIDEKFPDEDTRDDQNDDPDGDASNQE